MRPKPRPHIYSILQEEQTGSGAAELPGYDQRVAGTRAGSRDQIVRAFQRLRADEKTTEKIRRALGVALALLDERAIPVQGGGGIKPASPSDEAEKS